MKSIYPSTLGLVALVALIGLAAAAGCEGDMSLGEALGSDAGVDASAAPDATVIADASTGDGSSDAGGDAGPDLPEIVEEPHPNTLDQERLFTCGDGQALSGPAKIRRLRQEQFKVRFVPNLPAVPFGPDERYRYTTDARDGRMDDAAVGQLLYQAGRLGQRAADRRIGWGYCMRQSTLEAQGLERPDRACLEEWAAEFLKNAWQRDATSEEVGRLVDYAEASIDLHGTQGGLELAAARPYLAPEFLFRTELGAGEADADGRRRLTSWETAQAITSAITDAALVRWYYTREVDEYLYPLLDGLVAAAQADELQTREQVELHVRALLEERLRRQGFPEHWVLPSNIARFFQEYLGHPAARYVFKNGGELPPERQYVYWDPDLYPTSMESTLGNLVGSDRDVLERVLTTSWFHINTGDRAEFGWAFNLADGDSRTDDEPVAAWQEMPADQRSGLLTHPAWLIAHSKNQHTEPHPVRRGKWIYENLLCGTVPEIPITVDAKLPDLPFMGVRQRLDIATGPDAEGGYCWGCHKLMNPLGIPFESYDHYGRHREYEKVEDGSFVPVNPATTLVSTGDPALDGQPVADALELVELLAGSERVEGCFVRNTFRYFMGRPETYEDACTLAAMRDAYRANEGSFREMLIALMTSDTFLYRREEL